MKSLIAGLAFAVPLMFGAAPSWADDDHGRNARHWSKHAEKEWKREHKQWQKHQRQAERQHYRDARRHHYHSREVVVHHYAAPRVRQPRYYAPPAWAPAPAPGVHIVMPDVYIPF